MTFLSQQKKAMKVRPSDLTSSDWFEEAVRALLAKHQITNSSFSLQPHALQRYMGKFSISVEVSWKDKL
jgi:hypothetical protein